MTDNRDQTTRATGGTIRRELTRRQFLIGTAVGGGAALLAACARPGPTGSQAPAGAPGAAASPAARPDGWDALVAAARQEGTVVIYGGTSEALQQVMTEDFPAAYPGIKVENVSALGADLVPKIMAEREAGKYLPDVMISGSFSMLGSLKPAGAVAPLRPALVLPEVTDESGWLQNRLWWADDDEPYTTLNFQGILIAPFYVNTTMVNIKDVDSYNFVLDPKWKGRMVSNDIRNTGPGGVPARYIYKHPELGLGPQWFEKLYSQQDVTLSRDQRQMVDWVAQGRFPIGLFLSETEASVAREQGLPIAPVPNDQFKEGSAIGPGNGSLSMFEPAPHPNAAKVLINWLLSRDGQIAWQKRTHFSSLRMDIPKDGLDEVYVPKRDRKYADGGTEEYGRVTGSVFGELITSALEKAGRQ